MALRGRLALLILLGPGVVAVFGQTQGLGTGSPPAGPTRVDPDKRAERPLTPAEERERAIQRLDPLNRQDPTGRADQVREAGQSGGGPGVRELPAIPSSLPQGFVTPSSQGPRIVDRTSDDSGTGTGKSESADAAYNGPAVLSRSYTLTRPAIPKTIKWATSLSLSSFYDSGLPTTSSETGAVRTQGSPGMQYGWTLSGRHNWKRDGVGLDYSGNYNSYYGARSFSGSNHSLNFDYRHIFSRHLQLNVVQGLTATSQSFAQQNQLLAGSTSIANLAISASPSVDVQDQSVRQSQTSVSMTWQKTARTSFNFGGALFFVDRTGAGTVGVTGYTANGDYNYRLTRKMTTGAYYSFSTYLFAQDVSVSNSHTVGGIFSYALNRRMQARLRMGLTQLETQSLTPVPLDPLIAFLTGRRSGIISAYRHSAMQDISAQFVRELGRQKSIDVAYARGLSPGNGLTLASSRESLTAGLSVALRRVNRMSFSVGIDRLSTATTLDNSYSSRYLQVSYSRPHTRRLNSSYTVDYRWVEFTAGKAPYTQIRLSAGLSFRPDEGRLW